MRKKTMSILVLFCLQASLFAATPSIEVRIDSSPTEGNYYNPSNPQNANQSRPEGGISLQPGQSRTYTVTPQSTSSTGRTEINYDRDSIRSQEIRSPVNYHTPATVESQSTIPNAQTVPNQFRMREEQRVLPQGVERTLSIIKPDAIETNHIGEIISRFEKNGLRIVALKLTNLTQDQARAFYAVHRDKPFYEQLVQYMTSGPVVIMVLEGRNAIAKNRHLMGKTDPQQADPGTIRADFGESITRNAVHGSDSPETASEEIRFFFQPNELANYP